MAGVACLAVVAVVVSLTVGGGSSRPAVPKAVLASAIGAPDPTFHGNGTVLDAASSVATGVAVVPSGLPGAGDLVVSGSNGTSFQVGRFTSAGALDSNFGGGLTHYFAGYATAVAVVPAGRPGAGDVVAAGYANGSTCGAQAPTPVVAEYLSNGGLNPSFGNGGVAALTCPPSGGKLNGVVIDPAGNIDVAGEAFGASNAPSMLAASLSPTGVQQWSLSTLAGGTSSQANAVAYSPATGDVVAAGFSAVNGVQHLTLAAVKDGTLDSSFNPSSSFVASAPPGVVTLASGSSASGVTVVPGDKLLVAGTTIGSNFLLVRYLPTGQTDSTFGSGGQVANSPNLGATDGLSAVAYQPNGNYLAAVGYVSRSTTAGLVKSMIIAQYNANTGAPNLAFGSNGATVKGFGPFDASLSAVAIQGDGKTVGAGSAPVVNAVEGMVLIRLSGPSLGVGNVAQVQVRSTSPITVNFPATINVALSTAVSASFCGSPGTIVDHQGLCGTVQVPAGVTHFNVPLTVPITTQPGNSQTATLGAEAGSGLEISSTQPVGSIIIQHLPAAQPFTGYWLVASDGGIFAFGHVGFYGSTGAVHLTQPIVGMAATPDGRGYWLVASDGGIFSFGDAHFYGSTGAVHLTQPIVGMAATPDGRGYWLVASDGGIFSFGDARFYGSTGNVRLNRPIVGMASTPDGKGYWLVASDGGIFTFGDARFEGSTGAVHLTRPIVGMATFPGAPGYWLVASDGGIFSFGASAFHGSTGGIPLTRPVVGMAATPDGKGYWLVASDGGIFAFGDAQFFGSTGGIALTKPIVGMFG